MGASERSVTSVLQDIVRNIQEIIRSEVRLAKTEIREETLKVKPAAIMVGMGALCGVFAAFFLLLAAVYGLTRLMPDWAAALTVAFVVAIVAAIALTAGSQRFKQVHPAPDKTIRSIKENVEWAKQQAK